MASHSTRTRGPAAPSAELPAPAPAPPAECGPCRVSFHCAAKDSCGTCGPTETSCIEQTSCSWNSTDSLCRPVGQPAPPAPPPPDRPDGSVPQPEPEPEMDPCAAVTCDAASDSCHVLGGCVGGRCSAETTVEDGTSCDDGISATMGDVCVAGLCAGIEPTPTPPPPPPPPPMCTEADRRTLGHTWDSVPNGLSESCRQCRTMHSTVTTCVHTSYHCKPCSCPSTALLNRSQLRPWARGVGVILGLLPLGQWDYRGFELKTPITP